MVIFQTSLNMKKDKPLLIPKDLTLAEWLAKIEVPEQKRDCRINDYEFPTDEHREEFLGSIHSYSESTIRLLLRLFLIRGGTLGIDERTQHGLWSLTNGERLKLCQEYEFLRRLDEPPFHPWDGVTWILDLLPDYPAKAIDVLGAYFTAHCQFLPDGRIRGLADAEEIIRRRYLHVENPREALLSLRPDEFEYLIGALYEKLNFKVEITQRTRDGGVDVWARRSDEGGKALLLIQCKRESHTVGPKPGRELMGVVSAQKANMGVVVATCGFTRTARSEASASSRIELIDFKALNLLLNRHMGARWPDNMMFEIRRMQMSEAKARSAKK